MFDDETGAQAQEELSERIPIFIAPSLEPMPCDRWIARSLLHKACRRGEVQLAWRALATLMEAAPAGIWRALAIITMEDVGVCGAQVLAEIVSAGRDRRWRQAIGGDWKVAAYLAQRICEADHDQSACDLFHHVAENPACPPVLARPGPVRPAGSIDRGTPSTLTA